MKTGNIIDARRFAMGLDERPLTGLFPAVQERISNLYTVLSLCVCFVFRRVLAARLRLSIFGIPPLRSKRSCMHNVEEKAGRGIGSVGFGNC